MSDGLTDEERDEEAQRWYEGHYHPADSDPDSQPLPGIPMPQYTPTIIASCPRCGADLVDEGFHYWCPGCQEGISAREACQIDETDYEND